MYWPTALRADEQPRARDSSPCPGRRFPGPAHDRASYGGSDVHGIPDTPPDLGAPGCAEVLPYGHAFQPTGRTARTRTVSTPGNSCARSRNGELIARDPGPLGWLNACPGHQAARPRDATAARSSPAAHRPPSSRADVDAAACPGVRAGRVREDDPGRAVAGAE